jgi:TolB protein
MRDGNSEIYMMNADGSVVTRLTNDAAADESPTWSPDGSTIAFVSTRNGARDLYLVRANSGDIERVTVGAGVTRDMSHWSPDGTRIALQVARDTNYDIDVVRVADKQRLRLAATAAYDGMYTWSPDGTQLAFISARQGPDAVYVVDADGAHPRRMTTTSSLNPAWSR